METFTTALQGLPHAFGRALATDDIRIVLAAAVGVGLLAAIIAYRSQAAAARRQLKQARIELSKSQQHLDTLQNELTRYKVREARLVTLMRAERRSNGEKLALLEEAREKLRLQFATLAQEIFDNKSATFGRQSQERLETVLKPFHHQLDVLKGEIRQTFLSDTRERASLKKELQQLQDMNRQLGEEALNLTRALQGDKKLQGNWGELVLERVLEQTGLRRGTEFVTQPSLRDADNRLFKPDVVIHLPRGKDVIVDAKVSLVAWQRYCASEDDDQRQRALHELVTAIRNHIQGLGAKRYEELQGLKTLDFILMFMPIEAAFTAAATHDDRLLNEALGQKIVIVTPTTLLATLKTIENTWRYEHQNHNALEIARRAGALYDKFCGFVEDLDKIGKQLDLCRQTYSGAMNKLGRGRGNLVAQAQQLTELGVQVKKELSPVIAEQAEMELKN
ncbi:MAG: DNA recombination protein RmuC [Desulfopila sp.]